MIRQFWQARHWPPHLLVTAAHAHLRLLVQVDGLIHAVCLRTGLAQLSDRSSLAAFKNYKFFLIISPRKQAGAYFIRFILVNFLYVSVEISPPPRPPPHLPLLHLILSPASVPAL